MHAMLKRKIRPDDVEGLKELTKKISQEFGDTDISIMSKGGNFDLEPSMAITK
jgi:hypothetical protein